jgi:hypothetical protein
MNQIMSESSCIEILKQLFLIILFNIYLDFSYGDNGTFSPPMDVTNQMQHGNIQLASGNSNYSSGSGGDSPTSLSPGKKNEDKKKQFR